MKRILILAIILIAGAMLLTASPPTSPAIAVVPARATACPAGSSEFFAARTVTDKDKFGAVNYRWHFKVEYCRNTSTQRITKILGKHDWISDPLPWIVWTDNVTTTQSNVPAVNATVFRQREVDIVLVPKVYPWRLYPSMTLWLLGSGDVVVLNADSR